DAARQLLERVATRITLQPFTAQQTAHYLHARLLAAGLEGNTLFTPLANLVIQLGTGGRPRRIHILAHQALRQAWEAESKQVHAIHVWRAMAQDTPLAFLLEGYRPIMAGAILTSLLVAGIVPRHLTGSPAEQTRLEIPVQSVRATPRESGQSVPAPTPLDAPTSASATHSLPGSNVARVQSAPRPDMMADSLSKQAESTPATHVTIQGPVLPAPPSGRIQKVAVRVGNDAPSSDNSLRTQKTNREKPPHVHLTSNGPARPNGTASIPYLKENDPFGEAILASHRWLEQGNEHHYTIQLMLLNHDRGVELLTDQLAAIQPPPGELDLKIFRLNNDTLLVHLNECDSALACEALMNRLPVSMRANHPSVRSLARVKTTIHKLGLATSQRAESAPMHDRRS
ncbi:MAG: hypothetical protein HQL86_09695, partial [Magnetococcales bacterium]|nr:hypothetical protein [Magnetococcales bacterium]